MRACYFLLQFLLLSSLFFVLSNCQNGANCLYSTLLKRSDCRPVSETNFFKFTVIPNDLPAEVETILMSGNDISTLYPGNLTFYKNLTTLHLNNTLITSLPAGLATNGSSIQNLYLDGNPLTQIEDSAFQSFSNLRVLSLKRTFLTTLRSEMFTGLTSLEQLYLDESSLMSLPNFIFDELSNIKIISITNTNLQTLPDSVFDGLDLGSTDHKIYMANNPWSCDCDLLWLYLALPHHMTFPEDRNILRCRWPTTQLMTDLSLGDFTCYAPNVTVSPQNDSILTNRTYTLTCIVTGAPFPTVTWLQDGLPVDYTDQRRLNLYDASLHFTNVLLSDGGEYQCIVENKEGSDNSTIATLIVQEVTCFDNLLSSHETDIDCGGIYCKQCVQNQTCSKDTDCSDSLVCLYAHSLPSSLHYISPNNERAYKCDLPQVPHDLLDNRILDVMASINVNFTVELNLTDVQDAMTALLAEQLEVPISTFDDVRVTTVERTSSQSVPLVQIWFNLFKTSNGYKGHTNLLKQIEDGRMKGTVKIVESNSIFSIRINL